MSRAGVATDGHFMFVMLAVGLLLVCAWYEDPGGWSGGGEGVKKPACGGLMLRRFF